MTDLRRLHEICDQWTAYKTGVLGQSVFQQTTVTQARMKEFALTLNTHSRATLNLLGIDTPERLESLLEILTNSKTLIGHRR